MRSNEVRGQPTQYWAWMPGDEPSVVWTVPKDLQDIPAEGLGVKLVTVRQGFVAPLADWKLIVRDDAGSAPCILSESDVNSYSRDMLQRGFPGLAPRPSMDGNNLVWANVSSMSEARKRNVSRPTISPPGNSGRSPQPPMWPTPISGRQRSAETPWAGSQYSRRAESDKGASSLSSGAARAFNLSEAPRSSAVLDDGRFLALSFESQTIVVDLLTSVATRVTDFGAWMIRTATTSPGRRSADMWVSNSMPPRRRSISSTLVGRKPSTPTSWARSSSGRSFTQCRPMAPRLGHARVPSLPFASTSDRELASRRLAR